MITIYITPSALASDSLVIDLVKETRWLPVFDWFLLSPTAVFLRNVCYLVISLSFAHESIRLEIRESKSCHK